MDCSRQALWPPTVASKCLNEYIAYYDEIRTTYAERIIPLEKTAYHECIRFENNTLSLYAHVNTKQGVRAVTLTQIMDELLQACKRGIPFVEYTVNTYMYQAWKRDNVSILTGMCLIDGKLIPGAPSILTIFRKSTMATFTEQTSSTGLLRIEISA